MIRNCQIVYVSNDRAGATLYSLSLAYLYFCTTVRSKAERLKYQL